MCEHSGWGRWGHPVGTVHALGGVGLMASPSELRGEGARGSSVKRGSEQDSRALSWQLLSTRRELRTDPCAVLDAPKNTLWWAPALMPPLQKRQWHVERPGKLPRHPASEDESRGGRASMEPLHRRKRAGGRTSGGVWAGCRAASS